MSESCVFAGVRALPRGCGGPGTRHHVLSQSRIKRAFPHGAWKGILLPGARLVPLRRPGEEKPARELVGDLVYVPLRDLLADPRDKVDICWDHHQLVEQKRIYIVVPDVTWEFARELGMDGDLERDERRRVA